MARSRVAPSVAAQFLVFASASSVRYTPPGTLLVPLAAGEGPIRRHSLAVRSRGSMPHGEASSA
jgi:hypothetical protein